MGVRADPRAPSGYRHGMPKLNASQRAQLPDSAFAYIDSRGRRRLPIHDEGHVRNALARFEQVAFEDEAARERARTRLLNAARKYGIVPVGFITGQLRSERQHAVTGKYASHREVEARSSDVATLPTGFVTFLLTDIERSTTILQELGDGYAAVLKGVRDIVRQSVVTKGGQEVDARADEFFAVFPRAAGAIEAALALQLALSERNWPHDVTVRVRAGVHSGRPTLTDTGYVGLPVHTAARVCSAGHGGQVVVSGETETALGREALPGVALRSLGWHQLAGLSRPEQLFQLEAEGLLRDFPPLRTRVVSVPPAGAAPPP
jgi:class 3 adenylate cyclase